MLNSLIIKNFRSLEDFQVTKLGRVNLIVGKNNSGKSSVLEALRIYAGNANQGLLEKMAQGHDEKYYLDNHEQEGIDRALPYEDLFTGRQFPDAEKPIVIGEIDNVKEALTIDHVYLVEKDAIVTDEAGEKTSLKRQVSVIQPSPADYGQVVGDGLLVRKSGDATLIDFNKISPNFRRFVTVGNPLLPCSFIPTQLLAMNELAKDWDAIALTDAEETVKMAMKIILPEFENLIFVNDSFYSESKACQSALKSIHLTAPNNVQKKSKVIPFLAPFYVV